MVRPSARVDTQKNKLLDLSSDQMRRKLRTWLVQMKLCHLAGSKFGLYITRVFGVRRPAVALLKQT